MDVDMPSLFCVRFNMVDNQGYVENATCTYVYQITHQSY